MVAPVECIRFYCIETIATWSQGTAIPKRAIDSSFRHDVEGLFAKRLKCVSPRIKRTDGMCIWPCPPVRKLMYPSRGTRHVIAHTDGIMDDQSDASDHLIVGLLDGTAYLDYRYRISVI
jgi:hypothetical protein